jgi:hypothetical protein
LKRDRCGARSIPFLTASLFIMFSSFLFITKTLSA